MIELRDVTHRYGDSLALDSVSLTVPDGEFLVLAGANGSGKTTLVRHCNGLLTPDSGEVLVDGTPVADDLVAARTAVGMVFQDPRDQIVSATVGADVAFGPENLGLPREEIDRRVADALAAVGMTGRETERVDSLSGGERERVAIAGALAMEPSHLVLDEPFTGLDAPARESVVARLRERHAEGTGIVLVTHDLRDALPLADRVVAMDDGEIALDADPDEARDRLPALGVRVPTPESSVRDPASDSSLHASPNSSARESVDERADGSRGVADATDRATAGTADTADDSDDTADTADTDRC